MDSSPAFTLGEHYRIQNVDSGTYLELVRRPAGQQLVLRPYKAFSENQQWSFETFPSRQGYILQNLGSSVKSNGAPTYIHWNGVITLNRLEAASISLASFGEEHLIKLLHSNETASRLLCSNGGDTSTVVVRDDNGGIQLPNYAEDTFRWRLIPVWPSISGDQTYKILNLVTGLPLHINRTAVSASVGDAKGGLKSAHDQRWEVEPMLNGKIHLKNVSLDLFVRLLKSDPSLSDLIGDEEGEPWQLTRVGDIGYSITVQPPGIAATGKVTFALTLLQGSDQIVLAPLNDLRNQVWFFEWTPKGLKSGLDGSAAAPTLLATEESPNDQVK